MLSKRSLKTILGMIMTLSICVVSLGGCKGKEKTPGTEGTAEQKVSQEPAAIVNGQPILKSELDDALKVYIQRAEESPEHGGEAGKKMDETKIKEARQNILNQMIDVEVLYQAGKPLVSDADKKAQEKYDSYVQKAGSEQAFAAEVKKSNFTIEKVKEQLKKEAVVEGFFDSEAAKIIISDAAIKEFYDKNPQYFEQQEQVKASHILCKVDKNATKEQKDAALAKIKKAQGRLKKGEKFEDVAKEVSECPSAPQGGDLGLFNKGQMVKPFEDVAFALSVGKLSDIVETEFGYHIIKVTEKKKAGKIPLEEAKAKIEDHLRKTEFQPKIADIIKDLKAKAKIEMK